MVKIEKIIEKFKAVVPEFTWKRDEDDETIYGYYFTNRFSFYPNGTIENNMYPELLDTYFREDIEQCPKESREKYENYEWSGSTFDSEEDLDFFLRSLRRYVDECESVRHSNEDIDQIVFLHPDIPEDEVLGFLNDFKCVINSPNFCGYGVGIISTKNWDFRNEELIDLFCSSNGDAFGIEEYEDGDIDEDDEELLEELYKKYPEAKNIKSIYITSYD